MSTDDTEKSQTNRSKMTVTSKSTKRRQSKCIAATVPELVKQLGGNKCIEKILIANNGIAAVKCMRSIRRWAYSMFRNEKAIHFVAMVTPEDLSANAEYIKMADSYAHVPGGANNHNYANVDLIISLAQRYGVQGVWAGWGHASENPKLPEKLFKLNIAFLGPSASAMWALGDKIASSIVAQTAKVPTLPWSGSGLQLPEQYVREYELVTSVPDELYNKACVQGVERALQAASDIGYPVMIKASEGGGGKGIRKVSSQDDLPAALRQVQAEVPGSPIFIMKLATKSRHLEVQVLADQYGNAISLFGRDCSIQRRHQKIIEEAPTTVASPPIWKQMEQDAVTLAKLVGYVSAGTVEYLYHEDGSYAYLELNPRLQVEHPCTEMVANINLPSAQLQIAMGIPLHRIRDIRILYNEDPEADNMIDFTDPKSELQPNGHVIAARITSENPDEGFKPSSGTVQELNFRSSKNAWGYFSVGAAGGLHEFADSQFGHCFAWGETREYAISNMVMALKELSIRGDFRTTVEYLVRLLEDPSFQNNHIDTAWLDALIAEKMKSSEACTTTALVCTALHISDNKYRARFDFYKNSLEKGQVLALSTLQTTEVVELIHQGVKYVLVVTKISETGYYITCNNWNMEVDVYKLSDGGLLLSLDGISRTTYMKEEIDRYRITINNQTSVFEKENDPSLLRSPSAGKLLNIIVEDGQHVKADEVYAEIEVMKMVMTLTAPINGVVHYMKQPGSILEAGSTVARLEPDDPSRVRKAELYTGTLEKPLIQQQNGVKANKIFEDGYKKLSNVMKGFCHPEKVFEDKLIQSVDTLMTVLKDPTLPLLELQEVMTNLSGRLPASVEQYIRRVLSKYASNITSMMSQFPGLKIQQIIDAYAASFQNKSDQEVFLLNTQPIVKIIHRYRNGIRGHMKDVVLALIDDYYRVELLFQRGSFDKCLIKMRDSNKENVASVVNDALSYAAVANKNILVVKLLNRLTEHFNGLSDDITKTLENLALLSKQQNARVALRARQILIAANQPPYELRHNQVENIFLSSISSYSTEICQKILEKLIMSETLIFDVIPDFFYHSNPVVRMAAFEVYVRRAYIAYELNSVQHHTICNKTGILEFQFMLPYTHPNRLSQREYQIPCATSLPKVASVGEGLNAIDPSFLPPCQRMGIMAAFKEFSSFKEHFSSIMSCFTNFSPPDSPITFDVRPASNSQHSSNQSASGNSFRFTKSGVCNESYASAMLQHQTSSGNLYKMNNGYNSSGNRSPTNGYNSTNEDSTSQSSSNNCEEPIHILNISIVTEKGVDDETLSQQFLKFVQSKKSDLFENGIRRITFLVHKKKEMPKYFTYRARESFEEDRIYRHLEPALAFQLELNRMRNFDLVAVPTSNHRLHVYLGSAKVEDGTEVNDHRFFVRAIIRHSDLVTKETSFEYLHNEAERLLLEAMDELEVAFSIHGNTRVDCNHIFMNFVPTVVVDPLRIDESIRSMVLRYGSRLWKLRVMQAEIKVNIRSKADSEPVPYRIFLTKDTDYYLDLSLYYEVTDKTTRRTSFKAYNPNKPGPLNGMQTNTAYVTKDLLQAKRFKAQNMGTTYVYDFLKLLKRALNTVWEDWAKKAGWGVSIPETLVSATELVLDNQGNLIEINRQHGSNNIAMVAWKITLYTPEYPQGRSVVWIANDITCSNGSFGPKEDLLYQRASELARNEGIPRIYISANSGARVGLAEEVRNLFKIAWVDDQNYQKGFKYVYVTPNDFKKLNATKSIVAEHVEENGESRYKILDIIGKDDTFGANCLRWSGTIAGETSRAYDEVVTISMVTCRAVGIGSYLVRLGQRVIQTEPSYVILTGYQALNKVLGREVYNSHNQLGGVQVMHSNGVSHATVQWDNQGIDLILKWLSYIPAFKNSPLPILVDPTDSVERDIDFCPLKTGYDPRCLLDGFTDPETEDWNSGFFDYGSFNEILSGWAKTVIVGRARLGGIPTGVVAVETRSIAVDVPADPADMESEEKTVHRAGQVWYPDSAHKTAQAINDFNREGLPLIMFANWRGFSGGMKDMYDEILKFGSYIVDALRKYEQPVLVYIPPHAELRGGAWVVVDPTINPSKMEMYADEESRGGVLEPQGTVEIKFRKREIIKLIERTDPEYASIKSKLTDKNSTLSDTEKSVLRGKLSSREEELMPVYLQVATKFADLHDTPGSLLEKGCISGVLKWKTSRKHLYWRLRRLLHQDEVRKRCQKINSELDMKQVDAMLRRWFIEDQTIVNAHLWDDNKSVAEWLQSQLSSSKSDSTLLENINLLQKESISQKILSMMSEQQPQAVMHSIVQLCDLLTKEQRQQVADLLKSSP